MLPPVDILENVVDVGLSRRDRITGTEILVGEVELYIDVTPVVDRFTP